MSDYKKRCDKLLFNYESTSRTDYRDGEIRPLVKTLYKKKPGCLRIMPRPLKDIHTLMDWSNPIVPFGLFTKPKEVVRTNPRKVQEPYLEPPDLDRLHVQKTRPRLVITPAEMLDNLDDERRPGFMRDYYETSTMRASRAVAEQAQRAKTVRAPVQSVPAPANPITLEKLRPPYVSPEWRMESASWDGKQHRAYCQPTREFWLARSPKCQECEDTAARVAKRKMERLMKRR